MVTEEPQTSLVVRVPAEPVIEAELAVVVVPGVRVELVAPEDPVVPVVRAALVVQENPAVPAARAALVAPESPVVQEDLVAPVVLESPVVQEDPAAPVVQESPVVQELEREAVPGRIRSVTAAHHRGQVLDLAAEE
jgi:hypothetical protein